MQKRHLCACVKGGSTKAESTKTRDCLLLSKQVLTTFFGYVGPAKSPYDKDYCKFLITNPCQLQFLAFGVAFYRMTSPPSVALFTFNLCQHEFSVSHLVILLLCVVLSTLSVHLNVFSSRPSQDISISPIFFNCSLRNIHNFPKSY